MKITWVLSDEERERRFNKLKKTSKNNTNTESKHPYQSVGRPSVLYLSFSMEEENILEDVKSKFQVPWVQNLLIFDRNAGIKIVEYAFGQADLQFGCWETFKQSMSLNFIRYILPRFPELADLSSHDIGQIMKSPNSGIAQFFRSCHMLHMGSKLEGKAACPVVSHVRWWS